MGGHAGDGDVVWGHSGHEPGGKAGEHGVGPDAHEVVMTVGQARARSALARCSGEVAARRSLFGVPAGGDVASAGLNTSDGRL